MSGALEAFGAKMEMLGIDRDWTIHILAALGFLGVALLIFLLRGGIGLSTGRFRGDTVLLLGTVGAGKTVLFHQLKHGKFVETVTSMKQEEAVVSVQSSDSDQVVQAKVLDFPGHERLRMRLHGIYPAAAAIVFLIDASAMPGSVRSAAEFLFDIFTDPTISDAAPRMLLALNKNDLAPVKYSQKIKESLEEELTQLKTTRNSLETEGEELDNFVPLGREGQPFKFDIDSPCEVQVGICSAKTGDIEVVTEFIYEALT